MPADCFWPVPQPRYHAANMSDFPDLFTEIDGDNDGVITKNEFQRQIFDSHGVSWRDVPNLLDQDRSGCAHAWDQA